MARAPAIALFLALLFHSASAWAEKRVALVIGNSAYANASRLDNPVRDAKAVAEALRAAGFAEVTEGYDLTKPQFDAALKRFGDAASGADWALVFYAGHGIGVGGESYLLPVDVVLARAEHVDDEAVSLARVRAKAGGAKALRMVILDSCRNNPFVARMKTEGGKRAVSRGLARPSEPEGGELIAYATRENDVAEDGEGQHSPFTAAFLAQLQEPGVEVGLLFRRIRSAVLRATNKAQDPAVYQSLPEDPFFFSPPQSGSASGGAGASEAGKQEQIAMAKPLPEAAKPIAQEIAKRPAISEQNAGQTVELAPHRAVYDLTLDHAAPASGLTGVRGQLVKDFKGSSCEGYTLNMRLTMKVFGRSGKSVSAEVHSESFEQSDGGGYRFNSAEYLNNQLHEATKGRARRNGDEILVDLEKPKSALLPIVGDPSFSKGSGLLFPVQHGLAIMKAAVSGESRLEAEIYDGSGKGATLYKTMAVIGAPLGLDANAQLRPVKNAETLDELPSWPVDIRYYDESKKKDGPVREDTYRMYANGVSRQFTADYGEYTLKGDLSAIEFTPAKPCDKTLNARN